MGKSESLDRLNKLLDCISSLPRYEKDNNPEYNKLFRRIKKTIEAIFEPSIDYIKDLNEIKFISNPMSQAFDDVNKTNGQLNSFNKSIIDIRALIESFIEEVEEWEDTEESKIINKLTTLKDKETLEIYLNQFERFCANEDFYKWKRSVDNLLIKIYGENHKRYKEFTRIEFLNYDRFTDGIVVPNDEIVFRKGLKESISLIESVISEIEDRYIKIEEENVQNSSNMNKKENIIMDKSKVFIVHGHDDGLVAKVQLFLKKIDLEGIVLHEQANLGKVIIEKLEHYTDVGFAIILYTPCDLGKAKADDELKARARQNVVFEHGYMMGKLGRDKVLFLVTDTIETPGDITGSVYIGKDNWEQKIGIELNSSGYEIDFNKIYK